MQIFACLFLLITVIMLPALSIFASIGGLKTATHGYYNSAWMLGNMGFNKAVCISNFIELNNERVLGCEVGYMMPLTSSGIIPNDIEDYATNSNMPYGWCGTANDKDAPVSPNTSTEICTDTYMDSTGLSALFDACVGETSCTV